MKKVYLMVFSILATGGLMAQTVSTNGVAKQELRTSSENGTFVRPVVSAERAADDIIWEDDFTDAGDWIAAGPSADYAESGWTIGTTTDSWWAGMEADMSTPGNFARFRNGNTTDFVEDGPFTLTYDGGMDLTGVPAPHVEFEQYGAIFFEVQAVQISTDGGSTWVEVGNNNDIDPLVLGGGAPFGRPETRRYNLTSALAGAPDISDVRVRLYWEGAMNGPSLNYISYGWYVDNMRVVEGHAYDSDIQEAYFRAGIGVSFENGLEYHYVPVDQATSPSFGIGFAAKTINQGGSTFTGLRLNAEVDKGGVVYTGTSDAVDLAPSAGDSLGTTTEFSPTELGTYNVSWIFTGDVADGFSPNDELTSSFRVTDNIFGRDNGVANGSIGNVTSNVGQPMSIGNVMDVFADGEIGALDIFITDAEENADQLIYGQIMKYNVDADTWDYLDQTADHTITAGEVGGSITLPFGETIAVSEGDLILVLAGHYGTDTPVRFSTAQGTDEQTVLGYTADGSSFSLLSPNAIMVRANFKSYVGIEDNVTANLFVGQNMPNPFNGNSIINYELIETAAVSVQIMDITGKVVKTINNGTQSAGKYTLNLNGADYAEGVYFYTFTVGNEKVTKRMVVTK